MLERCSFCKHPAEMTLDVDTYIFKLHAVYIEGDPRYPMFEKGACGSCGCKCPIIPEDVMCEGSHKDIDGWEPWTGNVKRGWERLKEMEVTFDVRL